MLSSYDSALFCKRSAVPLSIWWRDGFPVRHYTTASIDCSELLKSFTCLFCQLRESLGHSLFFGGLYLHICSEDMNRRECMFPTRSPYSCLWKPVCNVTQSNHHSIDAEVSVIGLHCTCFHNKLQYVCVFTGASEQRGQISMLSEQFHRFKWYF